MVVHLGLDNSGFAQKLTETSNSLQAFKRSIGTLERQLKTNNAMVQYAGNGSRAFHAYGSKAKTLSALIRQQSAYQAKLARDFERTKTATGALTDQSYRLAKEYQDGQAKLIAYRGELNQTIQTQYGQYGAMARLGRGLTTVSHGFGVVRDATYGMSTAMTAGFGAAITSAMDFEGGIKTIQALISDDVPANKMGATMERLSNSVKTFATQYGLSTEDVIGGMQEMIRRGYDVNQTMEAMPHVLNASIASGEQFSTVMNATTSILEQYGLTAKDTQRVTDSLTFIANKTATSFGNLATAMEYVGPTAHTAGLSMEETAAAIGLLSQRGIDGEKAGTGLRGVLTTLLKPTKANAAAFQQLGFSSEEFLNGAIKLPDVIDRIRESTKGMTDAQKASLIAQAFGRTSQAAINSLVEAGGDALRNYTKEAENAKGATQRMADQMLDSSQNKLARAKAELEVLGIEIGSRLLPMINDFLKEGIKVIDWFKELDPGMQDLIIKFGLGAAAISPFAGALQMLTGLGGGVFTMLGKLSGKVRTLFRGFRNVENITSAAGAIESLGGAALGAEVGVGELATSGGLLASVFTPTGLLVTGGIALAGALAYVGYQALQAKHRTEEWGTAVNGEQAKQLDNFKHKVDDVKQSMIDFEAGAGSVDKVTSSVQKLAQEIEKLADRKLSRQLDLIKELGLSDEHVSYARQNAQRIKTNVEHMANDIVSIYQNASEQHRQLTAQENAIVNSSMNEMIQTQLSLMKFSGKEKVAITQAINGQLDGLNKTQLTKARDTLANWIKEENASYEKKKAQLKEYYDTIQGYDDESIQRRKEVLSEMDALDAEHIAKKQAYGQRWLAIEKELLKDGLNSDNIQQRKAAMEQLQYQMQILGLSYEELEQKATTASNHMQEASTLWAQTTQQTTEAGRTANVQWNAMVWDLKEGKLKTNAQEEIQKALQAEGGWDSMKFVLKEANLTSNARMMVGEALVANGQWEALSPQEKALVVNNRPALEAILNSKEMLAQWDSLPPEMKELLANNENFVGNAGVAKAVLEAWNSLPAEQKELIAKNMTDGEVALAKASIDSLVDKIIQIQAQNATEVPAAEAQNTINGVQQYQAIILNALNNTGGEVANASASVNSILQNSPVNLFASDQTASAVAQALASVNSPTQTAPIGISASDNTSGQASSASSTVNAVKQNHAAKIDASNKTQGQASSASKDINAVKQNNAAKINAQNNTAGEVGNAYWTMNSLPNVVRYIDVYTRYHGHAKGTNFHPGGLAMVNDEKGPTYRELVTFPDGLSFIPEGRNVMLPLPRGSKVLKASKTKQLFPNYKDGIGYSKNSPLFQKMDSVQHVTLHGAEGKQSGSVDGLVDMIQAMLVQNENNIKRVLETVAKLIPSKLEINGREFGRLVEDITNKQNSQGRLNYYYGG